MRPAWWIFLKKYIKNGPKWKFGKVCVINYICTWSIPWKNQERNMHPNSLKNLQPKPFSSEYQPATQGRPKGLKNRQTLFRDRLAYKTEDTDPATGAMRIMSNADRIIEAMIRKAINGDTNAAILVLDSAYGKIANVTIQEKEKQTIDFNRLTDAELQQIEQAGKLFNKCIVSDIQDAEVIE